MMSRILIVVLALFAISDVQVALARLGNHHVHVPSRPTGHSKQIRKAHHTRRHLADGTGKQIAEQLKIVERPDFLENLGHIETVSNKQANGAKKKKGGEKKNGSD